MDEEEYANTLAAMGYERRREHLKEVAVARRKRAEERARMVVEDDRSRSARAYWLVADAEARNRKELADLGEEGEEDEVTGALRAEAEEEREKKEREEEDARRQAEEVARVAAEVVPELDLVPLEDPDDEAMFVDLPFWLDTPRGWDDMSYVEQTIVVKYWTGVRQRKKRIDRSVARGYARLEQLQAASHKEWTERNRLKELESNQAELKCLLVEEEMKEAESKLSDLKINQGHIRQYARAKGDLELREKSDLRRKLALATRRGEELKHSETWMKVCIQRQKVRDRQYEKVVVNCQWIDTDSITGFRQRFRTDVLFHKLYMNYFQELARGIVLRAETVATERLVMKTQELLTTNKIAIVDRATFLKMHAKDQRREDMMRMRRSLLNERLFPMHRREVLLQRFSGWMRFYFYKRGMREAFTCKYEVIKQQMDIDRKYKEQLKNENRQIAPTTAKSPYISPVKKTNDTSNYTVMQRHRERSNQCKTCRNFYLESQNNSFACSFHPNPYGVFCPKMCPNPGFTPVCASHRIRRWRCCDATREGASGCSRMYHMPPDSDPIYDKVMAKVEVRDEEWIGDLDERLEIARAEKYPDILQKTLATQVIRTEEEVGKVRRVAERYHQLKWA